MNRRNLLKVLLGTSATVTIPWTIPKHPWEKLKSRSDELVKKWKPILEYTSNIVKPLQKEKWSDLACLMEYTELKFLKYHNKGSKVLMYLIPAIRRFEGDIDYVRGEVYGRQYVEFKPLQESFEYYWLDRHFYWTELINYNTIRCYLTDVEV